MQDEKRIFIALNLSEEDKDSIKKIINGISSDLIMPRFIKPENAHMTLVFLGSMTSDKLKLLKKNLFRLEGLVGPLCFRWEGIEAFPNKQKARIAYVSLKDMKWKKTRELIRGIRWVCKRNEIELEKKPWKPHVTLARLNKAQALPDINLHGLKNRMIYLKTFELMESSSPPDGTEYKIIKSYKL
jgi:RNA 2',3'-cyclic 3'-phosphodiesterase